MLFLLVVAAILFFAGLGRLPLLEPDEGRNAEVAREMLATGDFITPHYNSLAYLDKPAVFFWLVAGSFRLLGVSEFAARLPSALAALGTMILVWMMARTMFAEDRAGQMPAPQRAARPRYGHDAGLRAAIIWATMPLVIIFSRQVIFDMTLTFLVTLSMLAFWIAAGTDFKRLWPEVVMFAAWGIAAITKGPVGFLLPLLSILTYQALAGRFRELKRLRWGLGIAVFLAAALPWFVAACVRNPDFARYALWQESLQRFATGSAKRGGSVFYYIPVFLAGLLPWSLFLLFAGRRNIVRWKQLRDEANRSVLFLLAWAGVIFVFFTISRSKLPAYFLPATVPFSILMSSAWTDVEDTAADRRPDWLKAGFAALIAAGLLITLAVWWMGQFAHLRDRLIQKVDPRVLATAKPSLVYTGLILAALGVLGRDLTERMRGRWRAPATFALLALTAPALFVRWLPALKAYASTSSSRRLAQNILSSPQKDWPVIGLYYFRTGLPFYLQRPVGLVSADGGQMTSNYQALHYAQFYAERQKEGIGNRESGVGKTNSSSPTPYSPLPTPGSSSLPFNGLLMDGADFQQRIHDSPQGALVLVRNDQAQLLMDSTPADSLVLGLWTGWQDSVWEVKKRSMKDE